MNYTEYIFGNLLQGYSQYPDDYTKAIFTNRDYNLRANSQIVIHREGSLIYYNYYRKLDSGANHYIGLSVSFNGLFFKDIKKLFNVFEQTISEMAISGSIIELSETGKVVAKVGALYFADVEVKHITKSLRLSIESLRDQLFGVLPPVNCSIDKRELLAFSLKGFNDKQKYQLESADRLVIYKDEDYNTVKLANVAQKLATLHNRNEELLNNNVALQKKINVLTKQKKQYGLLSLLSMVILIMGITLYLKVINPREVCKYQTEHFVYYGPLKNKMPHGQGVALYPDNDADGRRYYIGNFDNGERQDSTALLYYQNGDYYYGSMKGDEWGQGIFYSNSDNSHFEGVFKNNNPYDGRWYRHEFSYKLKNGTR